MDSRITDGSELWDDVEVVAAATIVRIDIPAQAADLARRLASRPTSIHAETIDELAEALLRGDLVLVRRSPPELDDWDGSACRPLCELSATGS